MRDAGVAVDAGHAARCHGLVRAGRHRWLLRESHGAGRMTAATLGGIVRLQLLPNFLRELQAMTFILCRGIELASHVSPHFSVRLDMPQEAWEESWRHVAVSTARLNAKLILVVHAVRVFLERRA